LLASQDGSDQIADDLLLGLFGKGAVPLLQTKLALATEQQNELNLDKRKIFELKKYINESKQ
jgi:hypothetical protein